MTFWLGAIVCLDLGAFFALAFATFNRVSMRSLSWDMAVCCVISSCLFAHTMIRDMYVNAIVEYSCSIVILQALTTVRAFLIHLTKWDCKEDGHGKGATHPRARPLLCRWYLLVPVAVAVAYVCQEWAARGEGGDGTSLLVPLYPLYIAAVAVVPQLWLVSLGEAQDFLVLLYLALTILSRVVEICSWFWLFGYSDWRIAVPIFFECAMGCDFLYFWFRCLLRAALPDTVVSV